VQAGGDLGRRNEPPTSSPVGDAKTPGGRRLFVRR
jgi:hypothetical protein